MGELKFAAQVSQTDANSILKDFVEHFVNKEKLRKYGLMWDSFAQKPKCVPMEEIRDIPISPEDRVFFYDERDKTLYATKMEEVVTYILKLEPWDQVLSKIWNVIDEVWENWQSMSGHGMFGKEADAYEGTKISFLCQTRGLAGYSGRTSK